MTVVAWTISKLRVAPTPGPSALTRSMHESRCAVVREETFALPELEDLGARGVTQQPKGAFSLGWIAICSPPCRETRRTQSSRPHHGNCTRPPPHQCLARRRASNSPQAQLVRMRNHPQLALAKKAQLAQVRDTPQLALAKETPRARVSCTPSQALTDRLHTCITVALTTLSKSDWRIAVVRRTVWTMGNASAPRQGW